MGLDCSHDAFYGAYGAFNRLRKMVAAGCGGSFPPHDPEFRLDEGAEPEAGHWYFDDDVVPAEHVEGCMLFLAHSDCDGILTPDECVKVAAFLRWVAEPAYRAGGGKWATGLLTRWGVQGTIERFAEGCEAAAAAGENLVFA